MISNLSTYVEKYMVDGGKCIVMGTGPSLASLPEETGLFSISVNDIGNYRRADTILIVDHFNSFTPKKRERMGYTVPFICPTEAKEWSDVVKGDIYTYSFSGYDCAEVDDCAAQDKLVVGHTSTFCALELAYILGFEEIALIGVDMTRGHAMNPDDTRLHELNRILKTVNREFENLNHMITRNGCRVYNLSQDSLITAFPKKTTEEFLNGKI